MSEPLPNPTILTTSEAAQFLRMSPAKLRDLAADGAVLSFHVGPRLRFRRQDLLDWLEREIGRSVGVAGTARLTPVD